MTSKDTLPPEMSAYERATWQRLQTHWDRRAERRALPTWLTDAGERSANVLSKTANRIGDRIPDAVKERSQQATELLGDKVLGPTVRGAVALLDLVNDWSAELNDPQTVVKIANKKGLEITDVSELRGRDLKACDRLLTRNTLKWRTFGALEGGSMGALAMVPVAGLPTSLTADLLVIQVLSTSIASRIAYSYGFDAKDPAEREFIRRLVTRSFMVQAGRAAPMQQVANAAVATHGRQRWSQNLLRDHQLAAALKRLMGNAGAAGPRASVQNVSKALPVIGIVLGAGTNSAVLGAVAADAQRYCQTRFLSEKYGLPMPEAFGSTTSNDQDRTDGEIVEEA